MLPVFHFILSDILRAFERGGRLQGQMCGTLQKSDRVRIWQYNVFLSFFFLPSSHLAVFVSTLVLFISVFKQKILNAIATCRS